VGLVCGAFLTKLFVRVVMAMNVMHRVWLSVYFILPCWRAFGVVCGLEFWGVFGVVCGLEFWGVFGVVCGLVWFVVWVLCAIYCCCLSYIYHCLD
jgi:hypothetical protein